MSSEGLAHIETVRALPGHRLAVTWDRFPAMTIDLSDEINRGGVFAQIADPEKFALVRVGERKRTINWPYPKDELGYPVIEIDAEALQIKGGRQRTDGLIASVMKFFKDVAQSLDVAS